MLKWPNRRGQQTSNIDGHVLRKENSHSAEKPKTISGRTDAEKMKEEIIKQQELELRSQRKLNENPGAIKDGAIAASSEKNKISKQKVNESDSGKTLSDTSKQHHIGRVIPHVTVSVRDEKTQLTSQEKANKIVGEVPQEKSEHEGQTSTEKEGEKTNDESKVAEQNPEAKLDNHQQQAQGDGDANDTYHRYRLHNAGQPNQKDSKSKDVSQEVHQQLDENAKEEGHQKDAAHPPQTPPSLQGVIMSLGMYVSQLDVFPLTEAAW